MKLLILGLHAISRTYKAKSERLHKLNFRLDRGLNFILDDGSGVQNSPDWIQLRFASLAKSIIKRTRQYHRIVLGTYSFSGRFEP